MYKKIELHYKRDDGTYEYIYSTNSSRTCKAAKIRYVDSLRILSPCIKLSELGLSILADNSRLKAYFDKGTKMLKWTKLPFFRQSATLDELTCIVGRDYGSTGNKAYYYIEVNDKVISHGHTRLKDAKQHVVDLINEGEL